MRRECEPKGCNFVISRLHLHRDFKTGNLITVYTSRAKTFRRKQHRCACVSALLLIVVVVGVVVEGGKR